MLRQGLTLPVVSFLFAAALSGAAVLGFWQMGSLAAGPVAAQQP